MSLSKQECQKNPKRQGSMETLFIDFFVNIYVLSVFNHYFGLFTMMLYSPLQHFVFTVTAAFFPPI